MYAIKWQLKNRKKDGLGMKFTAWRRSDARRSAI